MITRNQIIRLISMLVWVALVFSGCQDDGDLLHRCDDTRPCGDKETCIANACVVTQCLCPAVADPVCGVDGATYGNACEADCAGIEVGHSGACTTGCYSEDDCALGQSCTADQECLAPPGCTDPAACTGVCWGRCIEEGCDCPNTETPVCGTDGLTYLNECEAKCSGTGVRIKGPCPTCDDGPACELDCPWGLESDPNGCSLCQCAEPPSFCNGLGSCPEGYLCDRRACVPSCPDCDDCNAACLPISSCACPEPLPEDSVCGVNGVTYDSYCLAACVGVEALTKGTCGTGCKPLERCNLVCAWGYDIDADGCSLCSCAQGPTLCQSDAGCPSEMVCNPEACAPSCPSCDDCNAACELPALPCDCKPISEPVCGEDGLIYDNICLARCVGVAQAADESLCKTQACLCNANYEPVCGIHGNTFSNACEARCQGEEIVYFGHCECQKSCAQSVPVCGVNGVTYVCGIDEAICNHAEVRWAGACNAPQLCVREAECGPGAFCDPEACAPSCSSCDDCNSACKPLSPGGIQP